MMDDNDDAMSGATIACALTTSELRAREQQLQREVFGGLRAIGELADGYVLDFPGDGAWLATLAEFIRFERECCPFFTFALHCAPEHGPLRLTISGPDGAKEVVAALLGER
jgi:hypothetical protein